MNYLADNLWIFEGETVPFYAMPYQTRMTVVRLASGQLWLHSPIRLTEALQQQLAPLGEVAFLIAPNHLHHLFLGDWQAAYPDARSYGTREVMAKREDLHFDGELMDSADFPWSQELDQLMFTGSKVMEECVFFHRPSATMIVTDLVENIDPQIFKPWQRGLAGLAGVLAPNGKMPLDWRMTFLFKKAQTREHLRRMLDWQPQRLIMAHGKIIDRDAGDFLARSFRWAA